jgi:hypothetical protein
LPQSLVKERVAGLSFAALVRTVVQFNRGDNPGGLEVVEYEVHMFLGDPSARSAVPKMGRAFEQICKPCFKRDPEGLTDRIKERPVESLFAFGEKGRPRAIGKTRGRSRAAMSLNEKAAYCVHGPPKKCEGQVIGGAF